MARLEHASLFQRGGHSQVLAIQVRQVESQQLDLVATLLARAYKDDPEVLGFFGGYPQETRQDALSVYFKGTLRLAMRSGRILVALDRETPIGAVIYYPPGRFPQSLWSHALAFAPVLPELLHRIGLWRLWRVLRFIRQLADAHPGIRKHYYVEMACVDVPYQRHGVARTLLAPLFEQSDREQIGICAETSNPVNLEIWERFGVKAVACQDINDVTYWFLFREPVR